MEGAIKIITERETEMKLKDQEYKGGGKMKRMAMAVLVAVVLITAGNAFAYRSNPASVEVYKPTACPFDKNQF